MNTCVIFMYLEVWPQNEVIPEGTKRRYLGPTVCSCRNMYCIVWIYAELKDRDGIQLSLKSHMASVALIGVLTSLER
jgi:hypothetical protein